MKKFLLTLLVITLILPATLWAALAIWGDALLEFQLRPDVPFELAAIPRAPQYRQARYWAAFPGKDSPANLAPAGDTLAEWPAADVFYIHPTSYLTGGRWNAPLFADSRAWEMIDAMLASQASAFNGCCDVYAPHYRQATLWSFMDTEGFGGEQALELAYSDVVAAFEVFLETHNQGRPFVIASHSQGTYHALRLLAEYVEGTELADSLVAAYLVGYWVPMDTFDRILPGIPPCARAEDTGCVVHWSTYGDGGQGRDAIPHWYPEGQELLADKDILCTNPLTWQRDGGYADASLHPGALHLSTGGSPLNTLLNTPAGIQYQSLPGVLEEWTWAECRDGLLYVAPQEDTRFAEGAGAGNRDYHIMDYNLFYQAVRENAARRVASFLSQGSSGLALRQRQTQPPG